MVTDTEAFVEQVPFTIVYLNTYGVVVAPIVPPTSPLAIAVLPVGGKIVGVLGPETKLQLPVPGEGSFPTRKAAVALHNE